jgi:hypothetical protein
VAPQERIGIVSESGLGLKYGLLDCGSSDEFPFVTPLNLVG